jgi:polysaccharide deacetylase family protein (PEP-CTERM system associated)
MTNALSIDVEEYFHPTEVQDASGMAAWAAYPSRVVPQTDRILDLLARYSQSATFFVLGWVAERQPQLIRRIAAAGHEIGCHSYQHRLVYDLTPVEFRKDTERAVMAIEHACGITPRTYRAPSYSITARSTWALDILVETGFSHDSSIYPIRHDRYGIPGFRREAQVLQTGSGPIVEIPIATARLSGDTIAPVGGGAYMRLLPYRYMAAGIRRINRDEQRPACLYLHPWEIDAGIPRLTRGFISRARTYTGLSGMLRKFERLLQDFRFAPISTVYPADDIPAADAGISSHSRTTVQMARSEL